MLIGRLAGVVSAERALYCLLCHLFLYFNLRNILCLNSLRRPQWAPFGNSYQCLASVSAQDRTGRLVFVQLCFDTLVGTGTWLCAASWGGRLFLHF